MLPAPVSQADSGTRARKSARVLASSLIRPSRQLVTGPQREQRVLYRAPYATEWSTLDLDTAMGMVADRVLDARAKGWQESDEQGRKLRRTMGVASLGGATLDNEENYLIKKLFTALGAIQIENQARI